MFLLCISVASASWAYSFVVNDGKVFVVTEEPVKESVVREVIGKVTYHTSEEGTYIGNFSNAYPKGTKYFAIEGIAPEEAIAVQKRDGTFVKALYEQEYIGDVAKLNSMVFTLWFLFSGAVVTVIGFIASSVIHKNKV